MAWPFDTPISRRKQIGSLAPRMASATETPIPTETPVPAQNDPVTTDPPVPPVTPAAPPGVVTNPDGSRSVGGYTVDAKGNMRSSPYSYRSDGGPQSYSWYGLDSQGGHNGQITADDYAAISQLDPTTAKYFYQNADGSYGYNANRYADDSRGVQRDAGGNILSYTPLDDPNAYDPLRQMAQLEGRDQLSSADAEAQLRKELGQNGQSYTDPIDSGAIENYRLSKLTDTTGLTGDALTARQEQIAKRKTMNDAWSHFARSGSDASSLTPEEMTAIGVKPPPAPTPAPYQNTFYGQGNQPTPWGGGGFQPPSTPAASPWFGNASSPAQNAPQSTFSPWTGQQPSTMAPTPARRKAQPSTSAPSFWGGSQ